MGRLQNKTALVIGGTHGMGLATARVLLAEGAKVLVTGANPDNVSQAQHQLDNGGIAIRSDVACGEDLEALGREVSESFGALDALFVFAAVAEFSAFDQVSEQSFDRQFAVNTRGCFFAIQRIAPLIRDGGSITTVTVTPATATPSMSVYMATKGAVRAFSQVLAAELVGRRVRVNCLAPGFIDTPTMGVAGLSPEQRKELAEMGNFATPMKRHGTVGEVAAAAMFLGFDATFSTGIEFSVDGGISTIDVPQ